MKRITTTLVALLGRRADARRRRRRREAGTHAEDRPRSSSARPRRRPTSRAFKATYGKRAMRTCVKGEKSDARRRDQERRAGVQGRARRRSGARSPTTYGTGKNGKNAFGKCVSTKVKAEQQDADVAEFKNAAKECKAERKADPDAFKETYGTDKNGQERARQVRLREGQGGPTPSPESAGLIRPPPNPPRRVARRAAEAPRSGARSEMRRSPGAAFAFWSAGGRRRAGWRLGEAAQREPGQDAVGEREDRQVADRDADRGAGARRARPRAPAAPGRRGRAP